MVSPTFQIVATQEQKWLHPLAKKSSPYEHDNISCLHNKLVSKMSHNQFQSP
ncbi:hypothetical protein HanRHA438_Chr09g0374891 [Helianthus annuus]|nr:hypothetical protein HanHA300_Chr09g0300231 [Helianthus annuus]KAJ0540612.1 hypothetical protein HanHA89_Chr09g0318761 [Helianthus annuus]KAJ0705768.1 hypothetical protein HanLR1_Chr09g0299091 [Helianthus annuus]KAJ0886052.1 hypothetical protein HanRHA438_Chr09g0374891 [Helianthus annuus]